MKRLAILIPLSLAISTVLAATNSRPPSNNSGAGGAEAYFRCRDEQGQKRFGSSIPPECVGQDIEVLSERGNLIRVIDGTKTMAEKAARKSTEEAEQKAKADAEMRDHMLLDTYLSVADIERLRDQRIDLVQGQLMIDQQTLKSLLDREKNALEQVQHFRPYNPAANARAIPDNMIVDMVSIATNLKITEDRIASKKNELQELQAKFTSDILRFKELKGLK
jgi:hypothetical protein